MTLETNSIFLIPSNLKIGKSFMALAKALAVATGKPFWDRKTMQGDVLLLSLEDSDVRINKRIRMITDSPPSNLHIASANESDNVREINHGLIGQIKEQTKLHKGCSAAIDAKYMV